MLSGKGKEKGKRNNKKISRSNKQKKKLACAAHFTCTFICRFLALLQSETL